MDLEFLDSKNGEKTAKANGIYIHSPYSPQKEALRFTELLTCPFEPEYIVITEPGLSYVLPYLKEKYKKSKIGAIRYTDKFDSYNGLFDFVLHKNENKSLKNMLQSYFSEDKIFSVFFVSWKPSEKAFQKENDETWQEIKEVLAFSKTLLITRQFFEKKWLLNTINFIKYSDNYFLLNQTDLPLLITASGPSLKENLMTIKKLEKYCIIAALSSALPVLLSFDITPDFCMTTDGGYWAKEHLKKIRKKNIPLAITSEANCQKSILQNNPIIPLSYSDGFSERICKLTEIPFIKASRNGTVSGTALELAMEITCGNIYFFGLDLSEAKGFQHTQPNELETNNSINDCKLNSKEKRISRQSFKNESLEIYKNWFSEKKLPENKIFRVISNDLRKNSLGKISDISPDDFSNIALSIIADGKIKKESKLLKKCNSSEAQKNLDIIRAFINNNSESEEWKKALFPLDYTALQHNPENQEILSKLKKENSRLILKIQKILNDE